MYVPKLATGRGRLIHKEWAIQGDNACSPHLHRHDYTNVHSLSTNTQYIWMNLLKIVVGHFTATGQKNVSIIPKLNMYGAFDLKKTLFNILFLSVYFKFPFQGCIHVQVKSVIKIVYIQCTKVCSDVEVI